MKNINDITAIHKDKSKKVQKGPFSFFRWMLKVELIILVIFFVIGILFYLIPDKTKFVIKYNIQKSFYSDIENENYNYQEIENALAQNNYIEFEEKEFISNIFKKEIEENINYIDINKTIKRLKNIQISYNKKYYYNAENARYELQNPEIVYMNIYGNYNAFFNQIDIYENIDKISINYENEVFDFASSDRQVLFHELNHLLTRNSFRLLNKNIFSEIINELFTREYLDDTYSEENGAYKNYMIYAYGLAEILSEDTIRKYKFSDNESILISGLLEIDNNIDEAYKLISSIDRVGLYENEIDDMKKENYKRIHDGYAYFYEKKYNKKLSDDLEMLLYFYGTPIQTEEERNIIRDFLDLEEYDEIISIIPKGYVSKDCIEKHNCVQVEYTQNGIRKYIEIDNM